MTYRLELVEELVTLEQNEEVITKWLKLALTKAPENELTSVLKAIIQGISILYLAKHEEEIVGVVVCEVVKHPAEYRMVIELLGGKDIQQWVDTITTIEEKAKDFNCTAVEIYGRPAWKKLLPEYRSERIILTKEIR